MIVLSLGIMNLARVLMARKRTIISATLTRIIPALSALPAITILFPHACCFANITTCHIAHRLYKKVQAIRLA